jgi:hypothetical protein
LGGGGEVKALLVLRHEAKNVLERVVAFLFFNGIQLVIWRINLLFIGFCFRITGTFVLVYRFYPNLIK